MLTAPLALEAVGPNPTDREKKGSKRHLPVDGRGVPLSFVVTGAIRYDVTQLDEVLQSHHGQAQVAKYSTQQAPVCRQRLSRRAGIGDKLLVRYEKLELRFVALNHIAAGVIAFHKVKLKVKIIHG